MLGIKMVVVTLTVCLWATALHAEITRDLSVPSYQGAFGLNIQELEKTYKEEVEDQVVEVEAERGMSVKFDGVTCSSALLAVATPADFAGARSSVLLPALAVFGGAKCASNMPSLMAPETFKGAQAV